MTTTSTYHHGNLRDTLVATVIAQLAQQHDAALSLRELARTVGVSVAAVYRHFPSKEALLAEVAAAGFASLIAKWETQLPPPGSLPAEQRFQLLGQQYIEFALAAPAHYRLMFEHQDVRQFPALQEAAQGVLPVCAADGGRRRARGGSRCALGQGRRQRRLVAGPRLRDAAAERPPGHGGRWRRFVAGHGAALLPVAGGGAAPGCLARRDKRNTVKLTRLPARRSQGLASLVIALTPESLGAPGRAGAPLHPYRHRFA